MSKASLLLIVIAIGVLAVVISAGIFYLGGVNGNSSPTPTPAPTATTTPTPTNSATATPNSTLTVTYSEIARNQTIIAIQFKLEPNSYIFQMNATSFILTEDGTRISANTNGPVVVGTQYSTLLFPINGYNGTDYRLSSDVLPPDTVWIKQ